MSSLTICSSNIATNKTPLPLPLADAYCLQYNENQKIAEIVQKGFHFVKLDRAASVRTAVAFSAGCFQDVAHLSLSLKGEGETKKEIAVATAVDVRSKQSFAFSSSVIDLTHQALPEFLAEQDSYFQEIANKVSEITECQMLIIGTSVKSAQNPEPSNFIFAKDCRSLLSKTIALFTNTLDNQLEIRANGISSPGLAKITSQIRQSPVFSKESLTAISGTACLLGTIYLGIKKPLID